MSWRLAWGLAISLLILFVVILMISPGTWALSAAILLVFGAGFTAMGSLERKVDRTRLLSRMDIHAKLPDSILSAGDWPNVESSDPWRARQRDETLAHLNKADWNKTWPAHWPRLLWLPLACSIFLAAVIWKVQMDWIYQQWRIQAAIHPENMTVAAEQVKPVEQVFKDWDEAQKIAPSPEMAELLKEIKPMRDEMAAGKMTEKQLFLKLNEVQARVQAAKDKLDAASLEPMAQSLADAVKDLDGMSGLSAALKRKDFAAAKEQAAEAEKKYSSGEAKMPEGANAQAASSKLAEAQQKASSDSQTASSLGQMKDGISKKDGSSMGKGLNGLKSGLGQQAQRESQSHNLGTQLAQLGQAKEGMGKGKGKGDGNGGIQEGMPQLSLAKSLEAQKGAGTGSDPNRFSAQTQLDANHQEMKITGTAGKGASETQTESTMDPHNEQTASSVNAEQFAAYKKLSEQATQDENLPVADRQMIKRYFENIRPQANPQ